LQNSPRRSKETQLALPGFNDDPAKSNEAKLEAIQMARHEEVLDRTQG
jgi:FeS assembly protein IscX